MVVIKSSFYLFIIFIIDNTVFGLNVLVSNPFDPFRLECPNKHGVLKIQLQRIESVGGIRTDNMITVFCESLAKLFPSERDESSQPFEESCKWTKPIVIPSVPDMKPQCGKREYLAGIAREAVDQYTFLCCMVTDRKRDACETLPIDLPTSENPVVLLYRPPQLTSGIGIRNGKLIVEFCTYAVLTQKEIDDEFIAAAKAKLDKWFEAQKKNQTSILKANGKSITSESDQNSKESDDQLNRPADFRTHNQVLPVIKPLNQQTAAGGQFAGRSAVQPPGVTPDAIQAARFGIILTTRTTSTTTTSKSRSNASTPKLGISTTKSVVAGTVAAKSAAASTATTKKPTAVAATKSAGLRASTAGFASLKSSSPSPIAAAITTKTSGGAETISSTKKTSAAATVTSQRASTLRVTNKPTTTAKSVLLINPTTKRLTTSTKSTTPKTSEPEISTDNQNEDENRGESSSDLTNGAQAEVDRSLAFPRLPLHKEDLARFNSLQPKGANFSSVDPKSGLSKFSNPNPGDETDVVYVDKDQQSSAPGSDSDSALATVATASTNDVEYYYYYEDGQPASVKPAHKLPQILTKSTKNPPATTAIGQVELRSITNTATKISTTTEASVPVAPKSGLCDSRRAATNTITGLIIACGQNEDIWVPPRCPQGTFCLKSSDSIFRVCCLAGFGA